MDFKTELQNLVNRYPGIIKGVKVEFVKSIEVSPNGAAPIVYREVPPIPIPAQPKMPINTGFTVTEEVIEMAPIAKPKKTTAQQMKDAEALKSTLAALKSI